MIKNKKILIYGDGLSENQVDEFNFLDGLTYNPSLFKNLGVKDYLDFVNKLSQKYSDKNLSFEVIADDDSNMIRQAMMIKEISKKNYIKIPITNTRGYFTRTVLQELIAQKCNLNITAVFTIGQVAKILDIISSHQHLIISVFAGRIFDAGVNALDHMKNFSKYIKSKTNSKLLWASPRMSYDYFNAVESNCDIITLQYDLLKKFILFDKNLEDFSLDTVKMFYNDAISAGYKF